MRLESTLEHTHSTLQLLEKNQQAWLETHEQAATAIGAIANRLDVHASMEEVQWDVVNKSNERIENLSAVLGQHLEGSGAVVSRIDNLEKILWSVVGALVSATFGTIGYLVTLLK